MFPQDPKSVHSVFIISCHLHKLSDVVCFNSVWCLGFWSEDDLFCQYFLMSRGSQRQIPTKGGNKDLFI